MTRSPLEAQDEKERLVDLTELVERERVVGLDDDGVAATVLHVTAPAWKRDRVHVTSDHASPP